MKNILQAAALIIMVTSAIVAAASSRPHGDEKCNQEWTKAVEKIDTGNSGITANNLHLIK